MEVYSPPLEIHELDRLINSMPIGLLVEDDKGRVVWANQTFVDFCGQRPESLAGTRVSELPLTRVPGIGGNADLFQIERPRKGSPEWLLCTWQRLSRENGRGLIARYYLDATEHRRVQRLRGFQLALQESSGLIDEVTSTLNRAGITQTLESEVSRSRRYHNPLAVVRLRLDIGGGALESPDIDTLMSTVARVLREKTRWVDRIGRWSEKEFLLVLPETNAAAATSLAEKIERSIVEQQASGPAHELSAITPRFGMAEWQRGDNALNLLDRAQAPLKTNGHG